MIFTIFKKELKDTLRDRRTLFMMLIIPVLVFPIILTLFVRVSEAFNEEASNKEIKIGYVGSDESYVRKKLEALSDEEGKKKFIAYSDTSSLKKDLKADSVQLGMYVPPGFNETMDKKEPAVLTIFYNATDLGMYDRAEKYMAKVQEEALIKRYDELKLNRTELTPIVTNYSNVASDKEMIGKLAGGILPYIFIAFGFLGCMYPAIDLFTGEKERGTIETLLTTPVKRWQILFGKMGVVVLSGLTAATFALLGLFLSIEVFDIVDNPELLEVIHGVLSGKFLLMLYGLLIPLTLFFAGVMIPVAVYAKSFKEAQSIITPLNIVMVLPAMIGFFPGIELTTVTACIPVVNVVLATKELIAGTLDWSLLGLSFGVMAILAIAAVTVSYRRFDKETNVVIS